MTSEVSQSEETTLIKEDKDEIQDERCSTCLRFPKAVYFIIITELCERFNYYGMRTILILYLTQHLWMQEGNAVSVYHLFVSLCYFTTIIGSFISDNYLGKYKTILFIAVLYTVGSTLMSLTAIPKVNLTGPMISLLLISFGTGGVKACVGPFGGDQIPPTKRVVIDSFFSMFYFAINLGALLSTIITPILRADVSCNGSDDCYPLAFGVPALLMGAALVIFIFGRRNYIDVPVRESIYMKSMGCVVVCLKNWCKHRKENPKKQFLDYAADEYSAEFIHDLRTLSRIATLYLPLPIYWALYEQMGSRWTLQAAELDGEIAGSINVLPDQLSILNVMFVMLFIPIFDSCIYPICYKIKPKLRPLRRMTVGISFTCAAFLAAFGLQLAIESRQPPPLRPLLDSRLYLASTGPCRSQLSVYPSSGGVQIIQAAPYAASTSGLDLRGGLHHIRVAVFDCPDTVWHKNTTVVLTASRINFLLVAGDRVQGGAQINIISDWHARDRKGHPMVRMAAAALATGVGGQQLTGAVRLSGAYTGKMVHQLIMVTNDSKAHITRWAKVITPGRYVWSFKIAGPTNATTKWVGALVYNGKSLGVNPVKIVSSAVTLYYAVMARPENSVVIIPLPINNGSTISIAWQVPQYLLISIGEVLVSITGLSFSYDQAPDGMKSLVNAFWYLSNAFGNIIVMVVAKLKLFEKLSWEYLIFALLCLVFNLIFAGLGFNYRMRESANAAGVEYESMVEVSPHETVE